MLKRSFELETTLKIETTFCDVHPTLKLVRGEMNWRSRYGPAIQQVFRCPHPKCDRLFHYDLGYFIIGPDDEPDASNLSTKPKCRKGHDTLHMLLTQVDGVLVYACFYPDCTTTLPYEPKAQPVSS
jgi:hypothetical protein